MRDVDGAVRRQRADDDWCSMVNWDEQRDNEIYSDGLADGRAEERRDTLRKVSALVGSGALSPPQDAMATFGFTEDEMRSTGERDSGQTACG